MLTKRVISNVGQPLCAPSGAPLSGIKISFILIDSIGKKNSVWDAISGERVEGVVQTTTDVNGEFSVELWPNDRGATVTQYLCRISTQGMYEFVASVPSGATALTWAQFMSNGNPLMAVGGGWNFATPEVPSGLIDGVNKVYMLLHAPVGGSLPLFVNNLFLIPGFDYTLLGATITLLGTALKPAAAGYPADTIYAGAYRY